MSKNEEWVTVNGRHMLVASGSGSSNKSSSGSSSKSSSGSSGSGKKKPVGKFDDLNVIKNKEEKKKKK